MTEDLWMDQPLDIPHDFVIELNYLVTTNHALVLQAINADEETDLAKIYSDNDEAQRAIENGIQNFYDILRRAANNQAMVALVTRLHHWLNKMARKIKGKADRGLIQAFNILNATLAGGPWPISEFEKLVTIRDSVIHGDGQGSWEFPPGTIRTVAAEYVNVCGETEVSEDQLKAAIAKSIEQVAWFDERLEAWCAAPRFSA